MGLRARGWQSPDGSDSENEAGSLARGRTLLTETHTNSGDRRPVDSRCRCVVLMAAGSRPVGYVTDMKGPAEAAARSARSREGRQHSRHEDPSQAAATGQARSCRTAKSVAIRTGMEVVINPHIYKENEIGWVGGRVKRGGGGGREANGRRSRRCRPSATHSGQRPRDEPHRPARRRRRRHGKECGRRQRCPGCIWPQHGGLCRIRGEARSRRARLQKQH